MADDALYHRSFLDVTKFATPARRQQDPLISGDRPREPVRGSIQGFRKLPTALVPMDLYPPVGQNFCGYATRWEKIWSKLCKDANIYEGPHSFAPVVDSGIFGYPVVGHYGRVSLSNILVPRGHGAFGFRLYSDLEDMMRAGVPAFLSYYTPVWTQSGDWEIYSDSGLYSYNVLVTVDGMIQAILGGVDQDHVEAESVTPLDILLIGKLLVDLGAYGGRRIIPALSRRGSTRAAALGITKELGVAAAAKPEANMLTGTATSYLPETGMPKPHFDAFRQAARETDSIAVVRNTNTVSTKWIERGFPGKPFNIKIKTSKTTGIVTASTAEEAGKARLEGMFVVEDGGVARRTIFSGGRRTVEEMKLDRADWPVEKGQVIDPVTKKPFVGDYDLMGVAPAKSMGRNIHVVPNQDLAQMGKANFSGPDVEKFQKAVNGKLDRPRVLHGAQDQYGGSALQTGFEKSGDVTVFYPDGTVRALKEAEVQGFYNQIGRQTARGKYPQPAGVSYPPDQLAARRASK
jgi:Anthrax toxin LF subunit